MKTSVMESARGGVHDLKVKKPFILGGRGRITDLKQ